MLKVFGSAPTELLQECTDPEELADYDIDKLIKLLEKESRGRHTLNVSGDSFFEEGDYHQARSPVTSEGLSAPAALRESSLWT